MTEDRLKSIESTWAPALSGGFKTPAALVAMEQVRELVAEVRSLQRQLGLAIAANLCHVPLDPVAAQAPKLYAVTKQVVAYLEAKDPTEPLAVEARSVLRRVESGR